MELYESEEQQVEALKQWWKENGRGIIFGLVLGLGGVGGWGLWQDRTHARAEAASIRYEQLLQAMERKDAAAVTEHGERLLADFSDTGYAPLTRLLLAKNDYQEERHEAAAAHLQWVIDNAPDTALKKTARLRLARLKFDRGETAAARKLLEPPEDGAFLASFEELRGDILLTQKDSDGARGAYTRALVHVPASGPARQRLEMKLDELGPVAAAVTPS